MPDSGQIYLSVVLPAFLEAENLRVLLPRIKQVLSKKPFSWEVLVVDSHQKLDDTEGACRENEVRYARRRGGDTFGDAVRTGIADACGKYLLFMDADGSHPPEFIDELLKHHADYDVVIASRYTEGGYTENYRTLVWMSRILNVTYAVLLGLKYKDISNSFKIYRGDYLRELSLRCSNFDIIEEILYQMHLRHPEVRVKEVPFSFKKRMFGETKRNLVWFIVTFIFTIARLRVSGKRAIRAKLPPCAP